MAPTFATKTVVYHGCRQICGTNVTLDQIEETLTNNLQTNCEVTASDPVEFGTGKGFLSLMVRVNLTWKPHGHDSSLPDCVVVKIPTSTKLPLLFGKMDNGEAIMAQMTKQLNNIHNCEVSTYDLFNQVKDPTVPLPKLYGSKKLIEGKQSEPAFIIMEDLSVKNELLNLTLMELPNEKQINQVLSALGSLHGWSVKNMLLINRVLHPFDILKIIELLWVEEEQQMCLMQTVNTPEWKQFLGAELISKLPSLFVSKEAYERLKCNASQFNIPLVLCHGDFHSSNVMFKKDNQGCASGNLGAVYDWQGAHVGNPMEDFLRIIQVGVSPSDHSTHIWRRHALRIYYDSFEHAFDGSPPFRFEELCEYFDEYYMISMRMYAPFIPNMLNNYTAETSLPGMTDSLLSDIRRQIMTDTKTVLKTIIDLMQL